MVWYMTIDYDSSECFDSRSLTMAPYFRSGCDAVRRLQMALLCVPVTQDGKRGTMLETVKRSM